MARLFGIEFTMTVAKSKGIRAARDFLLDNCKTSYLWMGDDDVVYSYDCLELLHEATSAKFNFSYLCGSKGDVNNRRGYGDFQIKLHTAKDLHDNCPFTWFYDKADCRGKYPEIFTADTGNMLVNIAAIRKFNVKFSVFNESLNSGGEDTIFALECGKAGLHAYFVPSAQSYHLEKEQVRFNEFAARGEMILRAAELRNYSGAQMDYVRKSFMPWLFK